MKRKLFNGFEVKATLDRRKTQFREVIKPQPKELKKYTLPWLHSTYWYDGDTLTDIKMPYKIGDRLWVAETWAQGFIDGVGDTIIYRENCPDFDKDLLFDGKWKSSVQMQEQASRITLEVTGVRVERLNEISQQDAIAEGIWEVDGLDPCDPMFLKSPPSEHRQTIYSTAKSAFASLWDSTNGKKHPWQSNPWVWVVDYKVVEVN